jgi:hypothetical protein
MTVILLATSGGISQVLPVCRFIADAGKPFRVDKCLKVKDWMTINALPPDGSNPGTDDARSGC